MSENTVLDTTIHGPPTTGSESDALPFALDLEALDDLVDKDPPQS